MSFLPAEEADDDYDSEDGFFDIDETISKAKKANVSFRTTDLTNQHNRGQDGNRNMHTKSGPHSHRAGIASSNKGGFSSLGSTNVYTLQDLKTAAMKGHAELVEKCLNQGLEVDEPLRSGWTALMYAAHNAQPDIVQLLLRRGASAKYQCDMFTVLMCASSSSSTIEENVGECVRRLIEAGANVNANDRYHVTSLMLASREGHLLAIRELIQHGANVNLQDSRGWTALTWATQRAKKAVVVELLDAGADPSIQHLDKLTVMDLAAHLPGDEILRQLPPMLTASTSYGEQDFVNDASLNQMLALLERRPANLMSPSGDMPQFTAKSKEADTGSYSTTDPEIKYTDLRYGELEVFLHGLDLPHLIGVFQRQLIDLNLLMTLTEQDLINAGVDQIGARKKLLEAVQAVHKKDWQPSSLVSIHFNKQIRCADAVAMVANSSKHLRYIGSTIVYVREQLKKHPEAITQPTDNVSPSQFMRHIEDTIQNVLALENQLKLLQTELKQEVKKRNQEPADILHEPDKKEKRKVHLIGFFGGAVVLCSCLWLGWSRRQHLLSFISTHVLSRISDNS